MAVETFINSMKDLRISDVEVIESDNSTHTAQQAAEVHGVPVSNIVKSLLICGASKGIVTVEVLETPVLTDKFYMILVPGDKRLDIEAWANRLKLENARMANADEVKSVTGYSIGGVPPFGHLHPITTYIEEGFDKEIELVAAAGSANSVFKITYKRLEEIVKSVNEGVAG